METVVVKARKMGNSIGTTFPREVVEKEHIKPNDSVVITIRKTRTLRELFGTLKFKQSAQEIKDELRREWGDD